MSLGKDGKPFHVTISTRPSTTIYERASELRAQVQQPVYDEVCFAPLVLMY